MADNSSGRKKTFIVSILTFLLVGGGIFLFFIIQGSNDLTKSKNSNFQYGSVVRGSVLPFFRAIGVLGEDEEALAKSAKARLKARGVLPEEETKDMDMAGWLAKNPGGASASAAAPRDSGVHRSASSQAPTAVPRMSGGGGGGIQSGGGSKSSGGSSRFEGGGDSGRTKISAGSAGAGSAGGSKGSLGSLRGAQALLSEGLRSGSAMTAKGKWDRSFGVGGGGTRGTGDMSYGKKGMLELDTIKSGEISNLKTTDINAKGAAASSPPGLDQEATAKAIADDKAKDPKDLAADIAKDAASKLGGAISGAGKGGGSSPGGADSKSTPDADPPPNIKDMATKERTPGGEGTYCPHGCTVPDICTSNCTTYKDNAPYYEKSGDNWVVGYTGQQIASDGTVTYYGDKCTVDATGKVVSVESHEGSSPDRMSLVK